MGLHAPLFNMWNCEYPYFFRETQRAMQLGQIPGYLARVDQKAVSPFAPIEKQLEARHPHWFPGERDNRAPVFVKRIDGQDFMDYGVSRDQAESFMRLLAGIGARRPADLVLAGHTHRHNEFMVKRLPTGELGYYMDFYTQNPAHYYPARFTQSWRAVVGGAPNLEPVTDVTYVDVVPGAAPDAAPSRMSQTAMHKYRLQIPPYATPLASAADPKAWWTEHRPLVLQTGALGPLDNTQVSFTGFRVVMVKKDVIDKIHFVSTERLEASQYRLPWEEAIRPDPFDALGDQGQVPWSSVAEGSTGPGGSVAAVLVNLNRIVLLVTDPDGGVFSTSGSAESGWGPWASVSEGRSVAGAPIASVLMTGQDGVSVFVTDPSGGIFTTSGRAGGSWAPWTSVAEGRTVAGGPIAAVVTGADRVALFVADAGGGIFMTSGSARSGWAPWTNVSEGRSIAGATLTAVSSGADRITLFVADQAGGVFTSSGSAASGWAPWTSVSDGRTVPGAPVTAVVAGPDLVTLVLADAAGSIFTTSGSAKAGWAPWTTVSEDKPSPAPASPPSAAARSSWRCLWPIPLVPSSGPPAVPRQGGSCGEVSQKAKRLPVRASRPCPSAATRLRYSLPIR